MDAEILNTLGLLSAIIGTVIIFKYGINLQQELPCIELEDNTIINHEKYGDITAKELRDKNAQEFRQCKIISRIGIFLVGMGFLFQLFAVWFPQLKLILGI